MKKTTHHRQAEYLYITCDYTLDQIMEELSIQKSDLEPFEAEWEHFRQCLRTAEYLYVRHEFSLEAIAQTVPIRMERLQQYQADWDQMRRVYLAPLPSGRAKLRQMIEREIEDIERRLRPRPSRTTLLKLYHALTLESSFLDQVEIFLNIFTQNFLPTLRCSDDQRTWLVQTLQRFRKFVTLQVLSGDR